MLIWKKRQCKNKVEKSDSAKYKDNQCQFPVEMSKLLIPKGYLKSNRRMKRQIERRLNENFRNIGNFFSVMDAM